MAKGCKFKEHVAGRNAEGVPVVIFQEGETYLVIAEVEEGTDDNGYEHASAYYFPNGLGIEKKYEDKLYEIVEVEDEV